MTVLNNLLVTLMVFHYLSNISAAEGPWAAELAAFAEEDRTQPFPAGNVVFVGSSSIRLWDLAKSFPQLDPPPLNRGFGGSHLSDTAEHWAELVEKHQPRAVVIYAGDNDLAAGKTAERVARDFDRIVKQWQPTAERTKLFYISIKPSPSRWHLAPEARRANELIRAKCQATEGATFVDIWTPMLDRHGQPQRKLFVEDRLHLNAQGYAVWTAAVGPLLEAQ
jgi:lysophospholipase L1-like esterase